LDWFDNTGHLVISNGPYSLVRYDPPAQFAELRAFRDPSYPFRPGDWSFGSPPEISLPQPEDVTITGGRDAQIQVSVQGAGQLGLKYLLIDPATREVIDSGDARRTGGTFVVDLEGSITGSLFPGLYELDLLAYSDAIARVEERTVSIDVQ
jgi:peptide/nickel transport system substrate-binding protein